MAATYDPLLPTEKDWVRHLIGDIDMVRPVFQDEEIVATLTSLNENRNETAYTLGLMLYTKTSGLVSKQVGDLKLTYKDDYGKAYLEYLNRLRRGGKRMAVLRNV